MKLNSNRNLKRSTALVLVLAACCAAAALRWWFLLTLPLFAVHLYGVWTRTDRALDRFFPLLVLGSFALALLY